MVQSHGLGFRGGSGFETGTFPPKLGCQKTAKGDICPESVKETFSYVALKDCCSERCPDKTPQVGGPHTQTFVPPSSG